MAVGRFGGNTHYFTIQALRRFGMDASKDIQTIQTGGGPETLAALIERQCRCGGLGCAGRCRCGRPGDIVTSSMVWTSAFPMALLSLSPCAR